MRYPLVCTKQKKTKMIHPLIDVNKWVLYDTVAAALLTVFDK
jgi:hypothetical protein